MPAFATAPAWYRPVLQAEAALLARVQDRLPHSAELHGDDAEVAEYATSAVGVQAAERIVPGANASPYLIEHVARYLWAMNLARGQDVVDLGSGEGYGTQLLGWAARSACGVDISESAVAHARAKYPEISYEVADLCTGENLPPAGLATCFEVLEHLEDPRALLRTAASRYPRVLLSFPNPLAGGSHINPHHLNDWPIRTLRRELRRAGARRVNVYHQRGFPRRGAYYGVRRGAHTWHATWLFDVGFQAR